jgi:hypothetical protein
MDVELTFSGKVLLFLLIVLIISMWVGSISEAIEKGNSKKEKIVYIYVDRDANLPKGTLKGASK